MLPTGVLRPQESARRHPVSTRLVYLAAAVYAWWLILGKLLP